jgi:hypothetical protein
MPQTTKTYNPGAANVGGLHSAWLLADDPRTINTKDGSQRTVVELRDPRWLSQSLVIWLDGDVGGRLRQRPREPRHLPDGERIDLAPLDHLHHTLEPRTRPIKRPSGSGRRQSRRVPNRGPRTRA